MCMAVNKKGNVKILKMYENVKRNLIIKVLYDIKIILLYT